MGLYCSAGNAQRDQCTIRSQAQQKCCQARDVGMLELLAALTKVHIPLRDKPPAWQHQHMAT